MTSVRQDQRLSDVCLPSLPLLSPPPSTPDTDVAHARATTFPPGSDGHPGQEKEAEGEEKQSGSEPEVSGMNASAAWCEWRSAAGVDPGPTDAVLCSVGSCNQSIQTSPFIVYLF